MKFFLPDALDLVDPGFNFEEETWSEDRVRQRDDLYIHEVFKTPVCDGYLVSKGIVDGFGNVGSRYTTGQRHRLLRSGAADFFRTRTAPNALQVMGDCGAFTYVNEKVPPYTVDEVIEFYENCGFDFGISVDHVILAYQPRWDDPGETVPPDLKERRELTLELGTQFLRESNRRKTRFRPLGVAQGWSPKSYAASVQALQRMGYEYIALGGMVPLKSNEVLACLEAIDAVRRPRVKFHLLGVTRTEHLSTFADRGVASFDSTSPLRQAFKDDKDNYYLPEEGALPAIRIPQVEGNPALQRAIAAGRVGQREARDLELAALAAMKKFDDGALSAEATLATLMNYDRLFAVATAKGNEDKKQTAGRKKRTDGAYEEVYRKVLKERPWTQCPCDVCRGLKHHVILFRGAERNRRRGFHNIWTFYRRLNAQLRTAEVA